MCPHLIVGENNMGYFVLLQWGPERANDLPRVIAWRLVESYAFQDWKQVLGGEGQRLKEPLSWGKDYFFFLTQLRRIVWCCQIACRRTRDLEENRKWTKMEDENQIDWRNPKYSCFPGEWGREKGRCDTTIFLKPLIYNSILWLDWSKEGRTFYPLEHSRSRFE